MDPNLRNPPSGENKTEKGQPKREEAEGVDILKHCHNEFKMDISFFTKLYEQKIEIYKHRCEYINLLSSSKVHRMKVTVNHPYLPDGSEPVVFEHPYVSCSVVEIDKNSFPHIEGESTQNAVQSMSHEEMAEKENVTRRYTIPSDVSDGVEEPLSSMYTTRSADMKNTQGKDTKDKKRNSFSKKYRGILLNFNTLEEFLSTKRCTHINYTMSNLRRYLKKASHVNDGPADGTKKKDNIYEDSFWIYKPNELNYFEKINTYLILTFFDLKNFLCYYSLANPVVNPPVHFKMVEPSERLYFFIDSEVMYLDWRKNHINVGDLLYLSHQIDTSFQGNKLFIQSGAFLLLKFDMEELSLHNDDMYMEIYQSSLYRLVVSDQLGERKEEIDFASLDSFKGVCDYLFGIREKYSQRSNTCMYACSDSSVEQLKKFCTLDCNCHLDDPKVKYNNNPYHVLRSYAGLTVLPLSCLGELKEDLQNMKEKKLKYVKENFFHVYICLVDPNCFFTSLGWDFRNLLYCLSLKYELHDFEIELLIFRDFSLLSEELVCKAFSTHLLWNYPYLKNPIGIIPGMCNADISSMKNSQYRKVSKMVTRDYGAMHMEREREGIGKREEPYVGGKANSGETHISQGNGRLVKYMLNSSVFKIKVPGRGDLGGEAATGGAATGGAVTGEAATGEAATGEGAALVGAARVRCAPGWKRRAGAKGDSSIHKVSLRNFVNRDVVQRIALEQHVKLIKWKLLKDLKEEKITSLKVLILGMGTVGCNVARTCVTWGIKHLTFVDNSVVKHSNVGRQSLYTTDDVEDESKMPVHKVVAAKRSLLKIAPDLKIEAKFIDIPMPGHSIYVSNSRICKTRETIEELNYLISNHDVVFMATDSKESRYFPSLLIAEKQYNAMRQLQNGHNCEQQHRVTTLPTEDCTTPVGCDSPSDYHSDLYMQLSKQDNLTHEAIRERQTFYNNILTNVNQLAKMPPLGITIALGFESLHIIRHPYLYFKAGCFYCNDLHSPQNSSFGQPLDEKCTVTRGGLSSISGGLSVELLITLTQHPLYFFAPHTNRDQYVYSNHMHMSGGKPCKEETDMVKNNRGASSNCLVSCLGATPHILSLNLAEFTMRKMYCSAFDRCMCCSEKVILRYQECREAFVENVIRDSSVLERITGIDELREKESDVIMLD